MPFRDLPERAERALDVDVVHVGVRDHPERVLSAGAGEDAPLRKARERESASPQAPSKANRTMFVSTSAGSM